MTVVFEKCQEFEEKRLHFFKEMLFEIHRALNIAENPELPRIYEEYRHIIQNADSNKDLKWWSNNHGVGMPMAWPEFKVRFNFLLLFKITFSILPALFLPTFT